MAGTYGHEVKKPRQLVGHLRALLAAGDAAAAAKPRCLVTGYSCRSQVKRIEGSGVRHPLQALLEIIG